MVDQFYSSKTLIHSQSSNLSKLRKDCWIAILTKTITSDLWR